MSSAVQRKVQAGFASGACMPETWPHALVRQNILEPVRQGRPQLCGHSKQAEVERALQQICLHAGLLLRHNGLSCTLPHQSCQKHMVWLKLPVALACRAKTLVAGYIITTIVDMILIVCVGAYQTGDAALDGGALPFMQG